MVNLSTLVMVPRWTTFRLRQVPFAPTERSEGPREEKKGKKSATIENPPTAAPVAMSRCTAMALVGRPKRRLVDGAATGKRCPGETPLAAGRESEAPNSPGHQSQGRLFEEEPSRQASETRSRNPYGEYGQRKLPH